MKVFCIGCKFFGIWMNIILLICGGVYVKEFEEKFVVEFIIFIDVFDVEDFLVLEMSISDIFELWSMGIVFILEDSCGEDFEEIIIECMGEIDGEIFRFWFVKKIYVGKKDFLVFIIWVEK